jgi:hypothetical protein
VFQLSDAAKRDGFRWNEYKIKCFYYAVILWCVVTNALAWYGNFNYSDKETKLNYIVNLNQLIFNGFMLVLLISLCSTLLYQLKKRYNFAYENQK